MDLIGNVRNETLDGALIFADNASCNYFDVHIFILKFDNSISFYLSPNDFSIIIWLADCTALEVLQVKQHWKDLLEKKKS